MSGYECTVPIETFPWAVETFEDRAAPTESFTLALLLNGGG
ncbi:MAG: hypothetical protein ACREJB_00820 [Planctomycetaceae bacterium]